MTYNSLPALEGPNVASSAAHMSLPLSNDIYESNKESIGAFLSAVFSADGYVSVTKKGAIIGLGMSNEMFIRDVGKLLEYYGIRYSIHKSVDKRSDYKRLDSYVITITDKFSQKLFLDNINFINPQKSEKLEFAYNKIQFSHHLMPFLQKKSLCIRTIQLLLLNLCRYN